LANRLESSKTNARSGTFTADETSDMSPAAIKQLYSDADVVVEKRRRQAAELQENKDRAERMRARIQESANVSCPYCGGKVNEILDPNWQMHYKNCEGVKIAGQKRQEHKSKVGAQKAVFIRLLDRQIPNSVNEINATLRELGAATFDLNQGLYINDDDIVKEAWEETKKEWRSQTDYQRQRRFKTLEDAKKFVETILQFYAQLDDEEEEVDSNANGGRSTKKTQKQ
jgi:hypothetical protein